MLGGYIIPIDTVTTCTGSGCLNHSPIVVNPNIIKYSVAFEHNCIGNKSNGIGWVRSNFIEVEVGIENNECSSFMVYPNPTNDKLLIKIESSEFEVKIFSTLGKLVLHENNLKILDVSNINKGIYIISIVTNGINTVKKIIIN